MRLILKTSSWYFLLFILFISLFCSCKKNEANVKNINTNINLFSELLTKEWSEAISEKNIKKLSDIYADTVFYYGKNLKKQNCLGDKEKFYNNNPSFSQIVGADMTVDSISPFERKIYFVKTVTLNMESKDYPSYLIFKNTGIKWLITSEGELTTHKNSADKRTKSLESINDDKWFVMSETEIQYLNENGDMISILVQLRTLMSDLQTTFTDGPSCFDKDGGNKVFSSSHWEVVINPGQLNEYSLPVEDWGGFVENTTHNGSLYNQSFFNDNEKLFFYYLGYGNCSDEELFLFYFNKSSGKISNSKFQYNSGNILESNSIFLLKYGNNMLKRITNIDCENQRSGCPLGSFKNFVFENGLGNGIVQFWKFNNENNIFYLYSLKKLSVDKFNESVTND